MPMLISSLLTPVFADLSSLTANALTASQAAGAFLLLLLYGLAVIPLAYVQSFSFRSPSAAQVKNLAGHPAERIHGACICTAVTVCHQILMLQSCRCRWPLQA